MRVQMKEKQKQPMPEKNNRSDKKRAGMGSFQHPCLTLDASYISTHPALCGLSHAVCFELVALVSDIFLMSPFGHRKVPLSYKPEPAFEAAPPQGPMTTARGKTREGERPQNPRCAS